MQAGIRRQLRALALVALVLPWTAGCDGGPTDPEPEEPVLEEIQVATPTPAPESTPVPTPEASPTPTPTPEPTPTPTPTPVPTPTPNPTPNPIPGGPGVPEILFTYVPPLGSFANVRGRALHVAPAAHRVTLYVRVSGLWWGPKPTWAKPLTRMNSNGAWSVDYTTGGSDEKASELVAYLVVAGYSPPRLAGAAALPASLDTDTLASVRAQR